MATPLRLGKEVFHLAVVSCNVLVSLELYKKSKFLFLDEATSALDPILNPKL